MTRRTLDNHKSIPKKVTKMVGKTYFFSGKYIDQHQRKETAHLIKDVKMTDFYLRNLADTEMSECVCFLIDFFGDVRWTNPFPLKNIID